MWPMQCCRSLCCLSSLLAFYICPSLLHTCIHTYATSVLTNLVVTIFLCFIPIRTLYRLKTKVGNHDMFYMRPSRYVPGVTPTKKIIDNLAYVMHTMLSRSSHADTHGIGFLANMDDCKCTCSKYLAETFIVRVHAWQHQLTCTFVNSSLPGTMRNFDVDYCYQFMMTLQGYVVPVRVQLFLIVNPPSWFDVIWKIMKPMLVPSFRKKVKMIHQDELHKYLQEDYLTYLPDDGMKGIGQANTTELVEDFVSYRKYIDDVQHPSYDWDGTGTNNEDTAISAAGADKNGGKSSRQPEFSTMFSKVLHEYEQDELPLAPFSNTNSCSAVTTKSKASATIVGPSHCSIGTASAKTHSVRHQSTHPLSFCRIR